MNPEEYSVALCGPQNFQVNMGGMLQVLSESIYSQGAEVFIREMMQNGVDALKAREIGDPDFKGEMSIEYSRDEDDGVTVTFEDNGIGLTPNEARSALATVGFGMKRAEEQVAGDSPFVGRFGIGTLSAFLVADEIHVVSKHAREQDAPGVIWKGRKAGIFVMETLTRELGPGTRVFLRLRPDAAREFTAERVLEVAQKYGRYLPQKITFREGNFSQSVTETPLWEQGLDATALRGAGRDVFDEPFLSAFPFRDPESGSEGIAFLKGETAYPNSAAFHTVFIKHMLISERAVELHPPGAPFLCLLMNSQRLTPNAGRDSLMDTDPLLPSLRACLHKALLRHLEELQTTNPDLLSLIARNQYRCLIQLAERDHGFLAILMGSLEMETSLGSFTLSRILQRFGGPIRYVEDDLDYQRLEAKARHEGDCILRVRTDDAHRLIRMVKNGTQDAMLQGITSKEYLGGLAKEDNALSAREQLVLKVAAGELTRENCGTAFCGSEDDLELGRVDMATMESLDRMFSLGGKQEEGSDSKKLLLNRHHPVIAQMIDGAATPETMGTWIRLIYHMLLLQAREHPTLKETRAFNRALLNAFTACTLNTD